MKKARIFPTAIGAILLALLLLPATVRGAAGDLYVSDSGNNVVYHFTPAGAKTTFSSILTPRGLAFDAAGNLFVGGFSSFSAGSGTIYKITLAGAKSVFASGLDSPWGLAFDSSGNLFVVDSPQSASSSIYKFSPAGVQSVFASGLTGSRGLAIDGANNVYLANTHSGTNTSDILKFTPAGVQSTFVAGLNSPFALYSDHSGNLLETDQGHGTGTGTVNAYSSTGAKTGTLTGFSNPIGVTKDAAGNIFVSNGPQTGNTSGTITKIATNGTQTTFASGLNVPNFLAFEPAVGSGQLLSISTRLDVRTGDEVAIAGFSIQGSSNKQVLVRALGPTLSQFGVPSVLPDPVLALHHTDAQGHDTVIATNDNWQTPNGAAIQATGKAPPNPLESAILETLAPGNYTAVMSGKGTQTGNGLVDVSDLDGSSSTTLSSISTRGFVGANNNVMIAGVTTGGAGTTTVVVRALGPSLTQFGVASVLANPELALYDANGALISSNNDWVTSPQKAQIQTSGLAPPNNLEPAIMSTLPAGNTTAIVNGVNSTTGNTLVEVYTLQ